MKRTINLSFILAFAMGMIFTGCGNSNNLIGDKVKEPFSGSKYESDKRHFRAVGKGDSMDDNIAKNKADLQAKKELAQQVQTTMKVVTDQFFAQTETNNTDEINDVFISLSREVTNTDIADLRKLGEEKYYNGDKYTVYIAYEIHKKQMLRFMKKKAKADARLDAIMQKTVEDIIDSELEKLED